MTKTDHTAIILTGGKGTRLGQGEKGLALLGGKTLIQHKIDQLTPYFDTIILVTNQPKLYKGYAIKIVTDLIPYQGPLMGLYSGLSRVKSNTAFVTAVDMPFFEAPLYQRLREKSVGFDIVIPRSDKGLQPLFALYSTECLASIKKMLDMDERKLGLLISKVKTLTLEKEEVSAVSPDEKSFININTQQNLMDINKEITHAT